MNKNLKNLASLKAADKDNYPALYEIIKMYNMSSITWQKWQNNLGDYIYINDDGNNLNVSFGFKELNDSFQFSTLKSIFNYSVLGIILEKEDELKFWLLGKDGIIRYFSYIDDSWGQEHLFTQSVALILCIVKMFFGYESSLSKKFKYKSFLILPTTLDDSEEYRLNYPQFMPLWDSLGIK